jgi:hypothetical protein
MSGKAVRLLKTNENKPHAVIQLHLELPLGAAVLLTKFLDAH